MKVAIIGLGALGSAYGAKFEQYDGCELSIILDKKRYDRYSKEAFIVNGEVVPFKYVVSEPGVEEMDVIIVAVKYHNLYDTIENMKPFVGSKTTILSLMNGIDTEEIIGNTFGMRHMVYGMTLGIDAFRIDYETNYTSLGRVSFGMNGDVPNDHIEKLDMLFKGAELDYEIPKNMYRKLWWKFMINVGVNQTSALLEANYSQLRSIPEATDLMRRAMFEVIDLAKASSVGLTENDYLQWLKVLDGLLPEGRSMMLQDLLAGRRSEVEMLAGVVVKMGKKHGIDTPVNAFFLQTIQAREAIIRKMG